MSVCLVAQSCLTFCDPMDCSLPVPLSMEILQAGMLVWVAMPSSRNLPNLGIELRSPALGADSLSSEPPGKPRNTAVAAYPSPGNLPDPGIEPGAPAL